MASFMEDLWSSIFTPGPTATLLIATNATFAALQLVLFILLLATHSVHFIALSVLSAGLWYSINWFAQEVRAAQEAQEAEKKRAESEHVLDKKDSVVEGAESETETESIPLPKKISKSPVVATGSATSSSLQPVERNTKKRPSIGGDSSGYGSTDSEWEKVEDK
ncbi:hypothetical protein N7495_001556 [Penicillium taxi]|uniref:uncharacterized protein n=1 Tax=Penicillium taxi TaxID=168475 RepID=UPI0025458C24|nr:uncharacterized protein N7495_001556 [Penicillium taxi]KAJ5908874.1 hypothetical protein N7495_001556 [Penicillium taxi]